VDAANRLVLHRVVDGVYEIIGDAAVAVFIQERRLPLPSNEISETFKESNLRLILGTVHLEVFGAIDQRTAEQSSYS
jgi:hypothetical protein